MRIAYLECTRCGEHLSADRPQNVCPKDGGVLYVRYDLASLKGKLRREDLSGRVASMWRYAEVLPDADPVTLGEGFTPMFPSRCGGGALPRQDGAQPRHHTTLEYANVYIKDEGLNPTGSFKARGMSVAVTMARHYGLKKLAAPSAGNAGGALAAYAAAAGIEAHIFMPKDVPMANRMECDYYGAHVTLVDGLISDCGRMVAERKEKEGWFDVSTLKEPFRVEGKKTMGYEVAEQMNWKLPQGIIYPTGGGVGMIGMWKAFDEMEKLGWIGSRRPKMIAVQADGCQPVVRAYLENEPRSRFYEDAHTLASGLRVPKPLGDFLVLNAVRESGGTAIAVSDEDMLEAGVHLASDEGIFAAPEGAACVDAAARLLRSRFLKSTDRIVIYNTGSGLKYPEAYSTRFPRSTSGEQDKLGGLITPR